MSYLTSISCLLTYRKCFNRQHGQRLAPYSCKVERVLDWYCISVLFLYVSQQLFTQAERRLWLFSRCSPSNSTTIPQVHERIQQSKVLLYNKCARNKFSQLFICNSIVIWTKQETYEKIITVNPFSV